jgi:quercetin dioxygenase-like cupin family protein
VSDRCYVLCGHIAIETRKPEARADLSAGDKHLVAAGVIHRIVNAGNTDAHLLLIQDGGLYDFIVCS